MPVSPKTSSDRRTLEVRIYAVYASLSPAEKRLADVLLRHQTDLPGFTSGELANEAGVSKATAARLVQALGYTSYGDARRQVRAFAHRSGQAPTPPADSPPPLGTPAIAEMAEADIDNIQTTTQSLEPAVLADVARRIAAARQLWILGLRSGYGLAQHAAHDFSLVTPGVRLVESTAAGQSHAVASICKDDVMLAVAFRRRPRLLPALFQAAREAGATTVLVTDLSAGASAKAADHVVRCKIGSPSPFGSLTAAVTVLNHLAWTVAALKGDECLHRVQRIDDLADRIEDVAPGRSD